MIATYAQAKHYLDGFINYEKVADFSYQRFLKPERMRALLTHCEIDPTQLSCIHIAGTKGKGSTAHLLAWMLASGGFRVGVYTSPHLFSFRERVKIAQRKNNRVIGTLIPRREVIRLVNALKRSLAKFSLSPEFGRLSFFELYTALAFKYFIEAKVDFAVLETGLGGRLDATNVVTPLASIITHIGYDHTNTLGTKLSQIAFEKAGIIKEHTPVIIARQRPAVLSQIIRQCRQKDAPLFVHGRHFQAAGIVQGRARSRFDFYFGNRSSIANLTLSLKGAYQIDNACLALAAWELLKEQGKLNGAAFSRESLRSCTVRGRFEIVSRNPFIIVDIAHNVASFTALAENLTFYFPKKKILLVFACSRDKDARGMIKKIPFSHLILTGFSNPRTRDPQELKKLLKIPQATVAKTPREALNEAFKRYTPQHSIVISGSLFLVSDVLKLLKHKSPAVCERA